MKTLKFGLLLCCLLLFPVSNALAGGADAYPEGAEAFESGMVPPPGLHFVNYNLFYMASDLKDNDGETVPGVDLELNVFAEVLRFVYTSKVQILGGNWGMQAFIPIMRVSMMDESKTGLGNIIIDPFIVSWHRPCFHAAMGLDIYLPTGAYDKNDMVNIGNNMVTFEPIFAFTYLPPNGWSWSMKFHYDISGENSDIKLKPGQEFHFDYGLGYKVHPKVKLGVAGYFYQQLTDDEADGVEVVDDRGRVFSIGPGVKFSCPDKRMALEFRLQQEMAVRNRPSGTAIWAKLVYSF
jgi:hypothetical protein